MGPSWSCSQGQNTGPQDQKRGNMNRKMMRDKRKKWTRTAQSPEEQDKKNRREKKMFYYIVDKA